MDHREIFYSPSSSLCLCENFFLEGLITESSDYTKYYSSLGHCDFLPYTCHSGITCRLRMNGAMRYLVLVHYCRQSR